MKIAASRQWIWLTLAVLSALGCQPVDEIRHYEVRKSQPTRRLLGAIVPHGDRAWFFKVTGSREALEAQADGFTGLVQSLRFADQPEATPQWSLPVGWQQKAGSGFRFATIEIPSPEERLELSVSQLPVPGGDRNEYILSNVNLWREQMGLKPIRADELASTAPQIALTDHPETKAFLVDFTGYAPRGAGHGGMSGGMSMAASSAAPTAVPVAAESKLGYQVPDGWTSGQLTISRGGIQVRRDAAFEVQDGEKRVEITITSLPAASNPILSNVNRWRQQIGLDPVSQDELKQEAKQLKVGDLTADYVSLTGSDQVILGAILVRQDVAWFVKLQGDSELAERERPHFESFVQSLEFQS